MKNKVGVDRVVTKARDAEIEYKRIQNSSEFAKFLEETSLPFEDFATIFDGIGWKKSLMKGKLKLYESLLKQFADLLSKDTYQLETYLLSGGHALSVGKRLVVKFERNSDEEYKLLLQIKGDTRIEDVKQEWPYIMELQKSLPGYRKGKRGWDSYNRDKKIVGAYKELGSAKRTLAELPKTIVGNWDESSIYKITSRYKKKTSATRLKPRK